MAKTKDNRSVLYVRLPSRDIVDTFDRLYPSCRSRFIYRALEYAVNSQSFLNHVLFDRDFGSFL